jgi:hypothetical protein
VGQQMAHGAPESVHARTSLVRPALSNRFGTADGTRQRRLRVFNAEEAPGCAIPRPRIERPQGGYSTGGSSLVPGLCDRDPGSSPRGGMLSGQRPRTSNDNT